MKPRLHVALRVAISLLAVAAVAEAAMVAGNIVYTKLQSTSLYKEPQPASPKLATKLALGQKMKVDEVRGIWLHVSNNSTAGWVFKGNLAETEPIVIKDLDAVPGVASETTATAAARGIDDMTKDYAGRHNLNSFTSDLEWMNDQCHAISDQELLLFLQENKKGEYQ